MNKETVTDWFEILTADAAREKVNAMRQPGNWRENYLRFIDRFSTAPFLRFRKIKPTFTAPWNQLIGNFHFVAAPFCFTWVRFRPDAPDGLPGKWFYINFSMSFAPNSDAAIKILVNDKGQRLLIWGYANSSNEELLNEPMEVKSRRTPVFRQEPDDIVLLCSDNPGSGEPVWACRYADLKIQNAAQKAAEVSGDKLKVVFDNYSELLAAIHEIQYITEMWGPEEKWQISTNREKILWGQGMRPETKYIILGSR